MLFELQANFYNKPFYDDGPRLCSLNASMTLGISWAKESQEDDTRMYMFMLSFIFKIWVEMGC